MSVSGVSGTNNAVPLFDPGQASANQTNAGPAKANNDNDADDSTKVTAKAPPAPGTGKLVDKTV